ncbi:MAG: glycine oxidase [Cryptosporangiaceae bacterium]|nr:glycine oxidase [Cryptosporangiaceae bacterium]
MIDVATRRIAVVGGGVIGLACAWRIAQRVPCEVTLIDPDPGAGASAVGAGMLAPLTEAHPTEPDLLELALDSAARFPAFAADLAAASGLDPGYETAGTLAVALTADDRAALGVLAGHLAAAGRDTELLGSRALRNLEPALAPGVRGGLRVDGDHSVDNRALLRSLRRAADRAGVRFVADQALAITDSGDRVTGVRLVGGAHQRADVVVAAAGCWSAGLHPAAAGLIRPVKGEIIRLRARAGVVRPQRTLRATVDGRSVYLVPRSSGELVVGATQYEAGFDTSVSAGAVHALLSDARAVLPGIDEYELTEARAGLRPGSRDNAPLIGPIGPAGLVAATGHHRNGILLAPVTADAITDFLIDGHLPWFAEAAAAARFQTVRR